MATVTCDSDVEPNRETCGTVFVPRDESFTKTIEQFGTSQCFDFPCGFATCSIRLFLVSASPPPTSGSLRLEDLLIGHHLNEEEGERFLREGRVRLGDGCSHSDLILEKCLRTMTRGEQSVLLFHYMPLGSPSKTEVRMRVTLDDFSHEEEEEEEEWKMSVDKLRMEAVRLKEKGVTLYSTDYRLAFVLFSRATKLLIAALGEEEEEEDGDLGSILASCYSNLAACQLLGKKYEHVVSNCNRALECLSVGLERGTLRIKVLYRRAVALTAVKEYELAAADLDQVLDAEPLNAAALLQKKVVANETAAINNSIRVAMKKMFK